MDRKFFSQVIQPSFSVFLFNLLIGTGQPNSASLNNRPIMAWDGKWAGLSWIAWYMGWTGPGPVPDRSGLAEGSSSTMGQSGEVINLLQKVAQARPGLPDPLSNIPIGPMHKHYGYLLVYRWYWLYQFENRIFMKWSPSSYKEILRHFKCKFYLLASGLIEYTNSNKKGLQYWGISSLSRR